jgi:glycosyltransferase involved in cell wall biosynthesis
MLVHYPVFGGPHNQALRLNEPLKRRGWTTTVLIPDEPGNAYQRLREAGVDVQTIRLGRLRANPSPLVQTRYALRFSNDIRNIRRMIREKRIDLVVVGGLINPQGAIAARMEHVPVVWQIVDTRTPPAIRYGAMQLVKRLANAVMSTGLETARCHPGALSMASRLVPFFPPVDCSAFQPNRQKRADVRAEWGVGENDLVLGSVGNINPQKGIECLISALANIRARVATTRLVLVGAEYETHRSYSLNLRTQMEQYGVAEGVDVLFTGARSDIARQLQGFDVFVMGSVPQSEGIPTAILEAMASGLPVVATEVGGVSEVVEEGVTGFVVPPLQPEAIASATLKLLSDGNLRSRMGAAARRHAVERFDVEVCANTHVRAFEAAMAHHRQRNSGSKPVASKAA